MSERVGVFLAILLLAGVPLAAQANPLHLDGHLLPLRTDSFSVYLVQGADTTAVGHVDDRLVAEGDSLVRIYTEFNAVMGAMFDTITVRLTDLRPLSFRTRSSSHRARLAYDSTSVAGWFRRVDGDSLSVAHALPPLVYDGTVFDLVIRASPLTDSIDLAVPAYLYESDTVETITGKVTGEATVDGRACWVFKASFAGMPVTFWIDKANRALRRQLLQIRDDAALLYVRPPRPVSNDRST